MWQQKNQFKCMQQYWKAKGALLLTEHTELQPQRLTWFQTFQLPTQPCPPAAPPPGGFSPLLSSFPPLFLTQAFSFLLALLLQPEKQRTISQGKPCSSWASRFSFPVVVAWGGSIFPDAHSEGKKNNTQQRVKQKIPKRSAFLWQIEKSPFSLALALFP